MVLVDIFVSNESYINGLWQEVELLFTYTRFCCDLEIVQEISLIGLTHLSVSACFLHVTLVLSIGTERDIRTADRERTGIQIDCVVSNAGTDHIPIVLFV